MLAEDAKRRQEATRFTSEHNPNSDGDGRFSTASLGATGAPREQAAAMVPGGVSFRTFDKIGYLEKVTADTTMPDELRARAQAELDRIEAGGPVDPAFVRIRNEAEAPAGTSDAELHRLAEEALARVKAERRAKRLDATREEVPPEQRGRQTDRRAHLWAL